MVVVIAIPWDAPLAILPIKFIHPCMLLERKTAKQLFAPLPQGQGTVIFKLDDEKVAISAWCSSRPIKLFWKNSKTA
jgi:hypothetical protein